jgi:hypothetical protein
MPNVIASEAKQSHEIAAAFGLAMAESVWNSSDTPRYRRKVISSPLYFFVISIVFLSVTTVQNGQRSLTILHGSFLGWLANFLE